LVARAAEIGRKGGDGRGSDAHLLTETPFAANLLVRE